MTLWDFIDRHPLWTLVGFLPLWLLLRSVLRRGPVIVRADVRVQHETGSDDPEGDEDDADPPSSTESPGRRKIAVVDQRRPN